MIIFLKRYELGNVKYEIMKNIQRYVKNRCGGGGDGDLTFQFNSLSLTRVSQIQIDLMPHSMSDSTYNFQLDEESKSLQRFNLGYKFELNELPS